MNHYERSQLMTGGAGAGVFFLQALISAWFVFLAATAGAALANWTRPVLWGMAAAGLAAVLVWFSGVGGWRRLVFGLEELTGTTDLDGDGEPGEPAVVRVEFEASAHTLQLYDLPVDPDKLLVFARNLLDGAGLTESNWCGSGGIFSRAEYIRLRDELIKRKFLTWRSPRDPARGCLLTKPGWALMRAIVRDDTPSASPARRGSL